MLGFLAALVGFISVALGAFGAHALQDGFSIEALGWWNTATQYLMVHAAAALAIALSQRGGITKIGGLCLVFGAALFAATLYCLALGAPRWLGAITPIGGIAMLAGWGLVAWGMRDRN